LGYGDWYGGGAESNWDEFDLMNIPVVASEWVPASQVGTSVLGVTGSSPISPGYWETVPLGSALGYFAGAPQLPQLQQPSWWGTFAKNFVSNFVSSNFYKQELSSGGCLDAFLEGVDQADILGPALNGSPNFAETNIKATAGSVAVSYAAGRLLTVPFRSSTVRGILEAGEAGAIYFAPVYIETQGAFGLFKEGVAALRGECH
jgi:hypothetical protein